MSKTTIADKRIRVRPSKTLINLLVEHKDTITELPENVATALKSNNLSVSAKVEILKSDLNIKQPQIDFQLLRSLQEDTNSKTKQNVKPDKKGNCVDDESKVDETQYDDKYLYLSDLRWLNIWLAKLRKEKGVDVYLHSLLESCALELPQNEVIERSPELEARCQRLREEQQNREYLNMTKNVDAHLKFVPEDTVAYQMKAVNSQIIAVLQFVLSVVAGFVFGFLGLELIYGGLDFGLRLLLGIFCALIIGVAEIYFLAKKLNDYDNAISNLKKSTTPVKKTQKPHAE